VIQPYYADASVQLFMGDCLDVLASLPDASIDACVTDPPYGIGFMAKHWDVPGGIGDFPMRRRVETDAVNTGASRQGGRQRSCADFQKRQARDARMYQDDSEMWAAAVFRVLKPGAHLVAFGSTRMYHRMASAIEDAGFEIRDSLAWLYGQGFPKSLNLGEGLGTALKPAFEPIVLARKPTQGTVAGNVATHGTGALNIEACRIGYSGEVDPSAARKAMGYSDTAKKALGRAVADASRSGFSGDVIGSDSSLGRWPANVCIDEIAAMVIDEQSGDCKAGGSLNGTEPSRPAKNVYGDYNDRREWDSYGDTGGASRFYYCAKPSRAERDEGTDGLQARQRDESRKAGNPGGDNPRNRGLQHRGNFHPTVKPVDLMRWLVRLVTPSNGLVLDPFLGSGTTGIACRYEQRRFIGIEREADYIDLAQRRIVSALPLLSVAGEPVAPADPDHGGTRSADLFP
jgi:DNA modification methylase